MKKNILFFLVGIVFVVGGITPVFGQSTLADSIKITASFEEKPLADILRDIETTHSVKFYYQVAEIPDQSFTRTYDKASLSQVLTDLLERSTLGYLPYRDFAIVLADQTLINESYSANYYQTLESNLNGEEADENDRKIVVGDFKKMSPTGRATVNGVVKDEDSGEPIIGATVFFSEINSGTSSDFDGSFKAEIPAGSYEVIVQYIGYEDLRKKLEVYSAGEVNFEISRAAVNLEEVIVSAQAADDNVQNAQIGVNRLDIKTIEKLPTFMGESDVVKTLLLNPGVTSVGEGATGFNVRGGSVDQNLVLQDEGFIFNAYHALGFFSTFNTDLIRGVDLYKGNIPAQFGGRLASVLDVQMRDGDFEKFRIKGGAGPVSSRISVEGPVVNGKSSFIAGFRSTYANWLLDVIKVEEVNRSSAFFYDANLRYTHRFDNKNILILSGYSSLDNFTYNETFGFRYKTQMGQLIYNKIFNDRFYNKFSVAGSIYQNQQSSFTGISGQTLDNDLAYFKFKDLLTFNPKEGLTLDLGISSIYYLTEPGKRSPLGTNSQIIPKELESEKGLESAVFVNTSYSISAALEVTGGIRFALYQFLGPKTINSYFNDDPNSVENLSGSNLQDGVIATYNSLEPRVSLRYTLSPSASVKTGYSRTAQFINQIFNTDTPTPTSQFQLSTSYIKPQRSHNFSLGFFKNFKDNNWETSAEIFGRVIDATFDYRDFAKLNVNEFLETEIIYGEGRAAGLELSIKKNKGTLNGWLSYTLARTEKRIEGINKGDWYPSNFDKPHDLSLVLNFNPNQRHTITLNFNYGTGRPTTPPLGNYITDRGLVVPIFSERNQVRIPDYHRLDIAYTIGRGYKKTAKVKTSWTISIYNVYGRKNAFSVYYTLGAFQLPQANKLAILGSAFPAITFNLEIL